MDYCPFVDEQNKVLYYTSKQTAVARESEFRNLSELLQELNQYANGRSRIYSIPWDAADW